jgi:hypothetical protein
MVLIQNLISKITGKHNDCVEIVGILFRRYETAVNKNSRDTCGTGWFYPAAQPDYEKASSPARSSESGCNLGKSCLENSFRKVSVWAKGGIKLLSELEDIQ